MPLINLATSLDFKKRKGEKEYRKPAVSMAVISGAVLVLIWMITSTV